MRHFALLQIFLHVLNKIFSSNPTKRRSKNYDKPWKARQIYDVEAYAQNGKKPSLTYFITCNLKSVS